MYEFKRVLHDRYRFNKQYNKSKLFIKFNLEKALSNSVKDSLNALVIKKNKIKKNTVRLTQLRHSAKYQ